MSKPWEPRPQWAVLLHGGLQPVVYGPTDEDTARDFAEFLTAEVDPATAYPLRSPTSELLAFWKQHDENVERP